MLASGEVCFGWQRDQLVVSMFRLNVIYEMWGKSYIEETAPAVDNKDLEGVVKI